MLSCPPNHSEWLWLWWSVCLPHYGLTTCPVHELVTCIHLSWSITWTGIKYLVLFQLHQSIKTELMRQMPHWYTGDQLQVLALVSFSRSSLSVLFFPHVAVVSTVKPPEIAGVEIDILRTSAAHHGLFFRNSKRGSALHSCYHASWRHAAAAQGQLTEINAMSANYLQKKMIRFIVVMQCFWAHNERWRWWLCIPS